MNATQFLTLMDRIEIHANYEYRASRTASKPVWYIIDSEDKEFFVSSETYHEARLCRAARILDLIEKGWEVDPAFIDQSHTDALNYAKSFE